MTLQSLGYIAVRSSRLDDWAAYGEKFLGLQLVEKTASLLRFRMDDRQQRIVVSTEEVSPTTFAFETADAAALDALAARLEGVRTQVTQLSGPECTARRIAGGIRFADPAGNRLEACHGAEATDAPFVPGRSIAGFRTGTLGMGHAVLHVERMEDMQWFYQDVLGFRLSDYTVRPFKACFFHLNPRHHSLALIETGRRGIHHLMMELAAIDDVGQAYDIANAENRVSTTLGRHTNDFMTSFYAKTPDDFLVEYGWGGRSIDPANWQPTEMTYGPSLWGHERTWMPPEQLAATRAIRAKAAAEGQRAPVQVMAGNYAVGVGSCAWWQGVKERQNDAT